VASSSGRLDGDEMTADPDDGDAGHATAAYICLMGSTTAEAGDIIR
jgi:hypothetical protein